MSTEKPNTEKPTKKTTVKPAKPENKFHKVLSKKDTNALLATVFKSDKVDKTRIKSVNHLRMYLIQRGLQAIQNSTK